MRDATTMMVARLALRQYAQQMLTPESMLAYLQVCLAERAKPHLLQRVFLPAAWRPAFLWLADRNAVESVRRSFPLPLLRIANRLALRLGHISRFDFEQASTWLRVICLFPKASAMPDDNKRLHDLKLWLTDREFIDLCKLSDRHDRKPGEMGRVIVRRYMYGNVAVIEADGNRAISADKGREP